MLIALRGVCKEAESDSFLALSTVIYDVLNESLSLCVLERLLELQFLLSVLAQACNNTQSGVCKYTPWVPHHVNARWHFKDKQKWRERATEKEREH